MHEGVVFRHVLKAVIHLVYSYSLLKSGKFQERTVLNTKLKTQKNLLCSAIKLRRRTLKKTRIVSKFVKKNSSRLQMIVIQA